MRITFVLPGYPWKPVGGFRVAYEYANHLVARGHNVAVVHARCLPNWSPPPPPNFYRWLRKKAGQIRNLFFRPKVNWQPIDERVKMLYVPEPTERYVPDSDAVFATAWQTAELVAKYPPEKGEKFYLVQDFEDFFGPKERLEATWKEAFKMIVISHWLYKKVVSIVGQRKDIIVIPNGINHQKFRLLNDIISRPKRVAMMYSNASYKAPEDGLRALEICKREFKDFQAVIFGPGAIPKRLPSWIEDKGTVDSETLVRLYNSASIFLSSSVAEGFAFPPAEAMACGCAVVATDSGGIREYAEHEETALLSPPRNPEALAENLLRVLKDDTLRIRLAQAGHERIKRFTWERSTNLLEKFILSSFRCVDRRR
ncbi:glycosyltransferase family 4 protein [Atrimonas thermophila]|uniref:glycosyltransferase family 4 protein n=1 Tax=Atrimonas thermophila TaxID=3064161 RepID=UPI00399CAD4F